MLFEIWLTELAKQGGEYILIQNPLYVFFPHWDTLFEL